MKFKIFGRIAAMAMVCICSATALSACEKECEHVYRWTVIEEATCTREGLKEGVCGLCGDVTTEIIPVDPDNHSYGDWVITLPTEEGQGKAVKTCSADSSHKLEVTLPALSDESSYASAAITTRPTVLGEGEKTYVYANDLQDVVFTVPVPARGIQTVADAVEVGADGKSRVRSASGIVQAYMQGNEPIDHTFSYEFGDGYTHINDGINNEEIWCALEDDGEFWGYKQSSASFSALTNSSYINGARLTFTFTGYTMDFYGAEDFLSTVYSWGSENTNGDFSESMEQTEDGTVYTFSFGYANGQLMYGEFSEVTVRFTLTDDYAIKSIDLQSVTWSNNFSDNESLRHLSWAFDENGNRVVVRDLEATYYDDDGEILTDENGEPLLIEEDTSLYYVDHITLTQTTLSELSKEELEAVPQNPCDRYALLISSFDVKFNGTVIGDDDVITINAADPVNSGSVYYLTLTNVLPVTADKSSETFDFFYVSDDVETPISSMTLDSVGVLAWYSDIGIGIKSKIAGEITIRVKTTRCTKDLHINVLPSAPSKISTAVYEYHDTGYIWNTSATSATVYVGQQLLFRAKSPENESLYTDSSYVAEITSGTGATVDTTELDGETVSKFTATKSGVYTITMTSMRNTSLTCTLTVTVEAAPLITELLSGTYAGTVDSPDRGTVVTLTFSQQAIIDNTILTGIITVSVNNTNETLSFAYDTSTHALTTSHYGGADLGYSVTLNEVYKLLITHPTGFGNKTETAIMTKQS